MTPVLKQFKRVLVTGAGGVLGTALTERLQKIEGLTVVAPDRKACDLLDQTAVEAYFAGFEPDLVMHLAGKVFGVQGNMSFGGQSYYENAKMNLNVIEATRKVKAKKIVCAGTTAIYSDLASLPMREDDLWLGAPHGSEGPYGHAKRGMLANLEAYKAQYGLDYAYLILTNLYGPNDRFDEIYGHVVPSLVSRLTRATLANTPEVVCWGDGSPTSDFLFSADAAEAFVVAADRGDGAMNTATGNAIPIRELVNAIVKHTGYPGKILWDISKPLGQLERSYNIDRISKLGWAAQYDIDRGAEETIAWFKTNMSSVRA